QNNLPADGKGLLLPLCTAFRSPGPDWNREPQTHRQKASLGPHSPQKSPAEPEKQVLFPSFPPGQTETWQLCTGGISRIPAAGRRASSPSPHRRYIRIWNRHTSYLSSSFSVIFFKKFSF